MVQKHFACALAFTLAIFTAASVNAQDHVLTIGSADGATGSNVVLNVTYDNNTTDDVQGWSYGVAHDSADLTLVDVVDGATTAGLLGGSGPDFNIVNLLAGGWTVGVVIELVGGGVLAPATGSVLNEATYTVEMPNPLMTADICFTDVLGVPPVASVIVINGASIAADLNCGTVTVPDVPQVTSFMYTAPTMDVANDAGSFDALIRMAQPQDSIDVEGVLDTQGFSMGLSNSAELTVVEVADIVTTGVLSSINGGDGPDFFGPTVLAGGWTIGVVYAFVDPTVIQFDPIGAEVLSVTYGIVGTPAVDSTTTLAWTDDLGTPAVANVVVVDGQSVAAGTVDGVITFTEVLIPTVSFIRGDANNDTINNIADGVFVIGYLYYGYTAPCVVACDANDDDLVDLSDAAYILNYQLLGGPVMPAPFPDCGTSEDTADVDLGCESGGC